MRKLVFVVAVLAVQSAICAATNDQELVKFGNKMVTRGYMREAIRRAGLARTGGHVRKENSAKGWFAVINAQKVVSVTELEKATATLDSQIHIQTKVVLDTGITLGNVKDKVTQAGAALGVAVIDDGAFPSFLVSPEDGWAIVNVAKLSADSPDAERLAKRVRCEVLRGFSFIAGDMSAAYGEALMQPIVAPKDLDAIPREEFAAALINTFALTLPHYGITPWYQRTYVKALEEGWAPAPKDKYQKALWDKIHELPTEPIKIKPETKKVEK